MKIKDILKASASIAGTLNPALGAVIGVVNTFLPDDKKIPVSSTGNDVTTALDNLPPNVRQEIMAKEIDLEMARVESWADIQKVHAESDSSGNSTRPQIAMMMAWAVLLSIMPIAWAVSYAILTSDDPLESASKNYLLVLGLIATPTVLLRSYFGMRTNEKKARYAASVGQTVNPAGVLSSLFGGKK